MATGKSEIIEEQCDMLVACDTPDVNPDLHYAISDSSLVYEGRLVVDKQFRTNDPRIYGGGTMAKFSRSVKDPVRFEYCSSREVGRLVGKSIVRNFRIAEEFDHGTADDALTLWGAKAIGCGLPGGAFFVFAGTKECMEVPSLSPPKVQMIHGICLPISVSNQEHSKLDGTISSRCPPNRFLYSASCRPGQDKSLIFSLC